ncbi:MAG TPA: helix-turn-helix domain-containing protein [Terriglobia bacterium]|nr:helix-turn-helix domain-containing protein [Terriglobia bacterium]
MQGKQPITKEFDSLKELSERTGKTYRTLHRAVQAGKIKTIRLGGSVMVPRREVERVLTKGF